MMKRFLSTTSSVSQLGSGRGRRMIKVRANRPIVQNQRKRNAELNENAKLVELDWRIVGATIIHRYPVISADLEDWEEKWYDLQEKISERRRARLMDLVGGTGSQFIPEKNPTPAEILESMPFQPAPRVTEADLTNDRHSMDRKLQESLYLIVKRNRSDNAWQFPQGKIMENELSLRTTAERVIDRAIGRTNRWFIGNAPSGHYMYEYPSAIKVARKQYGAKVFYFRAQLIAGAVKLETRLYKDYAWISRNEVEEYFDANTAAYLKALLPD